MSAVIPDGWCRTEIKIINYSYLWMIDNFSYHSQNKDEKLYSSVFNVDIGNAEIKFQLQLLNDKLDDEDYISLYLYQLKPYPLNKLFVNYRFSILNGKRERTSTNSKKASDKNFCNGGGWGWKCFIKHSTLNEKKNDLLQDDRLTLCCDLAIKSSTLTVSGQNSRIDLQAEDVEDCFVEEQRSLLDSKLFSDVTIVIGDREFAAHKNLLSARSTVFAAMFHNKMKESRENKVEINDITPEAFEIVLEYIYTGKAVNLKKSQCLDLVFYAADKYNLNGLKKMCEIELSKQINVENVSNMIIMAEMYEVKHLKERAVQFIAANSTEVLETEGWKILEECNHKTVLEIFHATAARKRKKQKKC